MLEPIVDQQPLRDKPFGPYRWAMDMAGLSFHERFILLALTDHDHVDTKTKTRKCFVFPSQSKLAKHLGIDRGKLYRTLASLEAKGLIRRDGRAKNNVVRYRLVYDATAASCGPEQQPENGGCGPQEQPVAVVSSSKLRSTAARTREGKQEEPTGEIARRVPHDNQDKITAQAPLVASLLATPAREELDHDGESGALLTDDGTGPSPSDESPTGSTGCGPEQQPEPDSPERYWWDDDDAA